MLRPPSLCALFLCAATSGTALADTPQNMFSVLHLNRTIDKAGAATHLSPLPEIYGTFGLSDKTSLSTMLDIINPFPDSLYEGAGINLLQAVINTETNEIKWSAGTFPGLRGIWTKCNVGKWPMIMPCSGNSRDLLHTEITGLTGVSVTLNAEQLGLNNTTLETAIGYRVPEWRRPLFGGKGLGEKYYPSDTIGDTTGSTWAPSLLSKIQHNFKVADNFSWNAALEVAHLAKGGNTAESENSIALQFTAFYDPTLTCPSSWCQFQS